MHHCAPPAGHHGLPEMMAAQERKLNLELLAQHAADEAFEVRMPSSSRS